METKPLPQSIAELERPCPALWRYYVFRSLLAGPGIVIVLPYLWFRYYTLRYRFDNEGVHMRVGILFRREVNLTYARIQDIHLRSNCVQRWLGLADVQVQTASGSAGAEMVIEGFKEFDAIRDFLYTHMRGYQGQPAVPVSGGNHAASAAHEESPTVVLLLGIRDELRRTREALEAKQPPPTSP